MTKNNERFLPDAPRPLLFGHRGCSTIAPENTIAAFQKILDFKIPGVELDIQMCRTGELVVFHDSNLKRITGADVEISTLDYSAIQKLDAGSLFSSAFPNERIPLFDDVLDLFDGTIYLDIEIKNPNRYAGEVEEKVARTIRRRNLIDQTIVSSFNPYSIREVRKIDPTISTALIYSRHPDVPWRLRNGGGRFLGKPDILKPDYRLLNPRSIFWKSTVFGYPIITWTTDDPEKTAAILDNGVAGVISNVPQDLIPAITARYNADA